MTRTYRAIIKFVFRYMPVAGLLLVSAAGCKDFVQVDPPISGINKDNAYDNDKSALSVMTGIYGRLVTPNFGVTYGNAGIGYLMGLYADELRNWNPNSTTRQQFYVNNLQATNTVSALWNPIYTEIYACNAAIEGFTTSAALSAAVKKQGEGEAKFMRAFLYFYAVNLFGDVPLAITTDYRANTLMARTPQATVYTQIIADLKDAQNLLGDAYLNGNGTAAQDRARPNKQVAAALLAKVYLYMKDWANAEAQASAVIADSRYALETDPANVFLAASKEGIWGLAPSVSSNYVVEDVNLYTFTPGIGPDNSKTVSLSDYVLNAFEANDKRFAAWVGRTDVPANGVSPAGTYYFSNKYRSKTPNTESYLVLRLAEMFLLRAEARAQQGNVAGAITDLDAVRTRAGLPGTTAATKDALLNALLQERRVELFCEMGNRWFDLKRTGVLNDVMSVITQQKGGTWNADWQLLPIPQSELLLNLSLSQNPGYPK